MANSGAVILLQHSDYEQTFTIRLIPWVHYVPLTHTCSDVIEIVEWLMEHEEDAYSLARNAKNFAESYLRAEDHLCYAATLLETLADIYSSPQACNATVPFDQNKLVPKESIM